MFIRRDRSAFTIALTIAVVSLFLIVGRQRPGDPFTVSASPGVTGGAASSGLPIVLAPAVQNVTVQNFSFSPAEVTIPAGTTVHWIFAGGVHTTTSGACCTPDGLWDSGIQSSGSFDHTFGTPGQFPYYCEVHGAMMTGTVIVTPATAAGATITGRVLDPEGRPLKAALVRLTDDVGEPRSVYVGRYGYYMFSDVPSGHTYTMSAFSRRYQFSPRIITVVDDLTGLDFVAEPNGGNAADRKPLSWLSEPQVCGPAVQKGTKV